MQPADDALQIGLGCKRTDAEQRFRFFVVGSQFLITDGPCEALMRGIGIELVPAVSQQCGSVPLGLAADIEVFLGRELSAATIAPELLALERSSMHDLVEVERAGVARQLLAFFDDGHPQSGAREPIRRCAAARTRTDDHGIEEGGSDGAHGNAPDVDVSG